MTFIKYVSALALCAFATAAAANSFPDKPIKMIVPFGAGGITDIVSRQLAKELSEQLGKTLWSKTGGAPAGP